MIYKGMARKKPKKSKAGSKGSVGAAPGRREDYVPPDDDGRMDFGGLPERDIKKNLGCG